MQTSLQILKIYLDTCCLCRLFDAQVQLRVRQETEAIRTILEAFETKRWRWIASEVLTNEVGKIRDAIKRDEAMNLLRRAYQTVSIDVTDDSRVTHLESLGFKPYDALHIACAEFGNADIFLTTDDQILSNATRYSAQLRVPVENPHTWLQGRNTMNQNQLREGKIAQRETPEKESFRAQLDRIFQYKDGKGNYTEERRQQPMPDIDTIVKEIYAERAAKEAAEKSASPEE